ncbi:P-loop containing nucleoside triphosphate hydrolase protein [Dactylonectria macrodidyma]|uniref:P-loop containing nucleoside triphosphate hydrolase protein n=1 Tax=Dactylonectria macrodidyma TaxID=307937 RepID=A0A9P9DY69_9HYPO|nr:P-loop containing nucleoside triphosphate hydrolase protein [Dactylonectria macrodidyma]
MTIYSSGRESVSDFVWKWRCKVRHPPSTLDKPVDLDSTTSEDDVKNTEPPKDPTFGSDTTIKTFFEGRNSSPPSYDWVDYPPKQLSKSAARAQDRVAIKVYKIKNLDKPCVAGRFALKYHMVEVQNPMLVAALEPILKKENVFLDVHGTATFSAPFRPLWFCQDDIKDLYRQTAADQPLKGFLQLFLRILDDMFSELRSKRRHLLQEGLIDFKTAWTLFPRGSTVYNYGLNSESLCKVEDTAYMSKGEGTFLVIKGKVMTFNGEEFVWQNKTLLLPEFNGNKPIREQRIYPLEFHSERESIMKRLIARGKKVLDLQGLKYSCYTGIALRDAGNCEVEKHNVEGRVLIDVVGYNKYHLTMGKRENKDPETERNRLRTRRIGDIDVVEEEEPAEKKTPGTQKKRLSEKMQLRNKKEMLEKPEELAFMSDMIGGYALKNKYWVQFYIEDIEPMVWNDQAFSHLVYDEQQKDLVLSFVENHNLKNNSQGVMDDVIVGKGQGLIMLLSGPPGTGKTLTAEAVADKTHRPLFYLQAEDLGISASTLGANIKRVFEMATDWDAVVLLDEADVFMAERNPNDIHRNELVSIFLRELEYFRGIIFLTTNLYHTVDTAFRSRVSLHLLFPALARDARESVWRKFLQRLPEPARVTDVTDGTAEEKQAAPAAMDRPIDDEDIAELALWQLNGREIKNAVKMVRSWCNQKDYVMSLGRMESGIKVTSPHASKDGDVDKELYE